MFQIKKYRVVKQKKIPRELNPDGTIRGLFAVCFEIHKCTSQEEHRDMSIVPLSWTKQNDFP